MTAAEGRPSRRGWRDELVVATSRAKGVTALPRRHRQSALGRGTSRFATDGLGATWVSPDEDVSNISCVPAPTILSPHVSTALGLIAAARIAGRHRFSGRTRDWRYSWARYHHPQLQRFISEDPLGFAGRDVNLYAYVRNSPTRFVDPSGLYTVEYTRPSADCMRLSGRKDDCRAPTGPPPPMLACVTGCAGIMGGVTTASATEVSGGRSGSPSMDAPRARLIATAMGTEAVHQIVTGVELAGGGLLLIAAGGGHPVTTVVGLGFYVYGTYEIGSGFYTLYELSKLADPR